MEKENLFKTIVKKSFWLYFFTILITPTGYIIKIIISWDLSVFDFWIIYSIISLIVLLSSLNDLWFTESLKYFLPKFIQEKNIDKQKSIMFYSLFFQFTSALIIFSILFYFADFIALNYLKTENFQAYSSVVKTFSFFFLLINFFQIINTFFLAIHNTFMQKMTEFIRMFSTLLFVIFISFSDIWTIYNYSFAWIFALFLATFFSIFIFFVKYYKNIKKWKLILEKTFLKQVFSYWIATFLSAQIWIILSQIDMQMILYFLWPKEAWFYSWYLTIVAIPFVIFGQIFWFLIPLISQYSSEKDYTSILKIRKALFEIFSVLWLFFSLFLFTFSRETVFVLFWEKFFPSSDILLFWALFLLFNFFLQINFWIIWWTWKAKQRLKIVSVWLILAIFTNYFFINYFWEKWASLATWIGFIFMFFLSEFAMKRYRFEINFWFFIKNFLSLILVFYLCFTFLSIELNSRIEVLFQIFAIWAIIFSMICLLNFKELKTLFYIYKDKK